MAEDLTQQQSGESTTDYAGMMDEVRGSGPDGTVREIPEAAQKAADRPREYVETDPKLMTDHERNGMDPNDPNNYGVGHPDDFRATERFSEDKAWEVAHARGVKQAEEALADANRNMNEINEQGREVLKTGTQMDVRRATQANRIATDRRAEAKYNQVDKVTRAAMDYEEQQRQQNRAA